jgi:hypothetical protein
MELVDVQREECLALLAEGVVGRMVYTEGAMPAAHPVTYCLDGDEVDAYDVLTRTGWSVLGIGMAYEVTDPDRLTVLADRMPPPWAPDRTGHTIAVPLQRLTGRRLSPARLGLDRRPA